MSKELSKLSMKQKLGAFLAGLIIFAILLYILFSIISPFLQLDKVVYRYAPEDSDDIFNLQEERMINADAYYPNESPSYGRWKRFNNFYQANKELKILVHGEVSLCKAYIQQNNPQQISDLDNQGSKVEIPRVDDETTKGIPLILDSKTNRWQNIAHIFSGDQLLVVAGANKIDNPASQHDRINNTTVSANCAAESLDHHPICGRYTIWKGYPEYYKPTVYNISENAYKKYITGVGYRTRNSDIPHCCDCTLQYSTEILPFKEDNSNSFDYKNTYSLSDLKPNKSFGIGDSFKSDPVMGFNHYKCADQHGRNYCGSPTNYHESSGGAGYYCSMPSQLSSSNYAVFNTWRGGNPQNEYDFINDLISARSSNSSSSPNSSQDINAPSMNTYLTTPWWYTNGLGLVSKINADNSVLSSYGSGYSIVQPYDITPERRNTEVIGPFDFDNETILVEGEYASEGFYQLRVYDPDGDHNDHNGGYVIYVKQTKCKRQNGVVRSDSIKSDRGAVELFWSDELDVDPNENFDANKVTQLSVVGGEASYITPSDGGFWLRIKNVQEDYSESLGAYNVSVFSKDNNAKAGLFQTKVMEPLISTIKDFILSKGKIVFQNMICYGESDKSRCSSFFSYLHGVLTLYIMSYGFMFLLGMVEMTQKDLIIRVIKIVVVASLMDGGTFEYFNEWVFPFISNGTDTIISNLAGFGGENNIFLFADPILSEILFTPRFYTKLFALISIGPHGLIFFLMMIVSIVIFMIAIFQAMAVYFMAICAEALLIVIAPIFLSFMLFETTKYLFDIWVKLILKYILEPIIIIGGLIVLTEMFTIILDYAMPYSVVFKCSIRIYSPFQLIMQFLPLPGMMADTPIFCLNGYVPWGFDVKDGASIIGVRMDYFIILLILSYIMYHYVPFASQMVSMLLSSYGSSSTAPAMQMTSDARNAALNQWAWMTKVDLNVKLKLEIGVII